MQNNVFSLNYKIFLEVILWHLHWKWQDTADSQHFKSNFFKFGQF